jgi:hypothetical protein
MMERRIDCRPFFKPWQNQEPFVELFVRLEELRSNDLKDGVREACEQPQVLLIHAV